MTINIYYVLRTQDVVLLGLYKRWTIGTRLGLLRLTFPPKQYFLNSLCRLF